MPTLPEQLSEIEKEEVRHQLSFPKYKKLESFLDSSEVIGGFIAFFLTVGIFYIIFGILFRASKWGDYVILWFYIGIFLCAYLQEQVAQLLKYLAHRLYKINKESLQRESEIRGETYKRKILIKAEIRKENEQAFIFRLNEFVYQIENKKLTIEEALITKEKLVRENTTIGIFGCQLYTKIYYTNIFKKIDEGLKRYDHPIIPNAESIPIKKEIISYKPPVHSTLPANKLIIPLPIMKSENSDKIKKNQKPPSSIPIEPTSRTESPIMKSGNAIDEEKFISELFENGKQDSITPREQREKSAAKIDYLKLQEKRQTIGLLGELYAMEWEKNRLQKSNQKLPLDKVIHISKTDDSLGYDIISFSEDNTPKYIEVKTTTDTYNSPSI